MNLMDLFVKIGVDDKASKELPGITKKFKTVASSMGGMLATAAKVGTAAIGAAAAGITALTKASVDQYAEYEQLVGGVETLFKSNADAVQAYAKNAYKAAGLSANEYMSTVTSFSASLLQSLGGDTEAAANYANTAITDMSDNANKMGTSMEMIQNAYQGFAKQNYTMLDNLKLGYGGTKEEMQRLLDEAEKISGIEYDISSYADIVDAIHVVQTEMGITGTTAEEAGRTIAGSVGSMQAAWANLVTGFANGNADIESLIGDLVTTIVGDGTESNLGVIGNVFPAIETALGGVAQLIEGAAPKIAETLPGLITRIVPSLISASTGVVNSIVEALPELLQTIANALIANAPALVQATIGLVQSLVQGIRDNYQILINGAFEIITTLANGILTMLPDIIKLGLDLIVSLANGIADSLPELIPTIVDVILQIVDTLTDPDTLSNLIDACIEIIMALADGLIDAIPKLLEKAPEIIENLVEALVENAPKLLDAAWELIDKLVSGIIDNLSEITESAKEIMTTLADGIKDYFNTMTDKGKEIVDKILSGITEWLSKVVDEGKEIINSVKDGIMEKINDAKKWGKDMIQNFLDGITEKWEALKEKVAGVAQTVKDFLGFSEPKKGPLSNFHTYAPDMMELFAKGIRDNEDVVKNQIEKSFDFGVKTMGFAGEYSGANGRRSGAYGATGVGNTFGDIHININGAQYSDEDALAEAMAVRLQNLMDRRELVWA